MPAATPVLLVATASRWYSTARAPRALAKAGFDVTLLAPRDALAAASRYVSRIAYLPDAATTVDWVHAFAATVKAGRPALVIPCDDVSFRLLAMLVIAPPPQLQPALQRELAALVRDSLGEPAHYETTQDKALLARAALRIGLPVAAQAIVATADEALRFADRHGLPVVVKQRGAQANDAAHIVESRDALALAIEALLDVDDAVGDPASRPTAFIRKHIDGYICHHYVAAWQGRLLGGYAGARLHAHGAPDAMIRFRDDALVRPLSERLVDACAMSGCCTIQYAIARATQSPFLLGIDRRVGSGTHCGGLMNADLYAALHDALLGTPCATRPALDAGEERIFVQFPVEWLRDETSPWLRRYPVDAPWDDPELLAAMLALRAVP
jgi:hypothetical protein